MIERITQKGERIVNFFKFGRTNDDSVYEEELRTATLNLNSKNDSASESKELASENKALNSNSNSTLAEKVMTDSILNMDVLSNEDFGPLSVFVEDKNVTDINWNGNDLWIDDITKGRYCSEVKLDKNFLMIFAKKMSNVVSKNFNKFSPILEAETDTLRVSIIHNEIANTGVVISIRKIPKVNRLSKESMVESGYCDELLEMFLAGCVKAKMNVMVGGLPGVGKTELVKYLARYIKDEDRVITIEDTLELHLHDLYPGKDIVELRTTEQFGYPQGIKAAVRLLAEWILISEIRSTEAQYLLESMSTGTHALSTIHTENAVKIPERFVSMVKGSNIASQILSDVHSYLDVGVYLKKYKTSDGIKRRVEQVCLFDKIGMANKCILLVDEGKWVCTDIPESFVRKFVASGTDIGKLMDKVKSKYLSKSA